MLWRFLIRLGLKKKESVKVNDGKNDNINPVVITGFAINGNKLLVLIWLGLLNFRKRSFI